MKKMYCVLITIILLFNSVNVTAMDDTVFEALANTREEYSEYIEKAIKKTGIDENDIDTEKITVYKMTAWENIENEYGDLCM